MYKPAPRCRRRGRPLPTFRPCSRRRRYSLGTGVPVVLVAGVVLLAEYGPDLLAGWIF